MAIGIISNLEPDPRKTAVPGQVTLEQTVISDQTAEQAISEFRLAAGHDIWFQLPDGTPSKSITFQRSAGTENTTLRYDVTLIRDAGTFINGTIGIEQTLTEESGIQTPGFCTLVIL